MVKHKKPLPYAKKGFRESVRESENLQFPKSKCKIYSCSLFLKKAIDNWKVQADIADRREYDEAAFKAAGLDKPPRLTNSNFFREKKNVFMGISNIPYFQDVQVRPHEAVHQPLQGKEVENLRIVTERLVTSISLSIYTTDVSLCQEIRAS